MRKQVGSWVFAALVILLAPLAVCASPAVASAAAESADVATPVAVRVTNLKHTGLRDEAAMVLVGTGLIVLAAAVRRAA